MGNRLMWQGNQPIIVGEATVQALKWETQQKSKECVRIPPILGGSSQDQDLVQLLITMVIVSPLRIGLWDPFQTA